MARISLSLQEIQQELRTSGRGPQPHTQLCVDSRPPTYKVLSTAPAGVAPASPSSKETVAAPSSSRGPRFTVRNAEGTEVTLDGGVDGRMVEILVGDVGTAEATEVVEPLPVVGQSPPPQDGNEKEKEEASLVVANPLEEETPEEKEDYASVQQCEEEDVRSFAFSCSSPWSVLPSFEVYQEEDAHSFSVAEESLSLVPRSPSSSSSSSSSRESYAPVFDTDNSSSSSSCSSSEGESDEESDDEEESRCCSCCASTAGQEEDSSMSSSCSSSSSFFSSSSCCSSLCEEDDEEESEMLPQLPPTIRLLQW